MPSSLNSVTGRKNDRLMLKKTLFPMLILVRHGECTSHCPDQLFGQLDLPLDPKGWYQIEKCGQLLSSIISQILHYQGCISSFYSSDLSRCLDTARILNRVIRRETGLKLDLIPQKNLREFHVGDWENVCLFNVEQQVKVYVEQYKKDPLNAKPPGSYAESEFMMNQRVNALLNDFKRLQKQTYFLRPLEGSPPAAFDQWLNFWACHNIFFEIHLWVVHEGSGRMILDLLNIESWKPNLEDEFINNVHQKFFERGDILMLSPLMSDKQQLTQQWNRAFHYKAKNYCNDLNLNLNLALAS